MQSYTYTSPLTTHQLQSVASVARSYDANGNTKQIGSNTFTYDDRNRLTAAGGATYSYNGKGERVMKRVNSADTLFVYGLGGNLLSEYRNPFTCTNPNYLNNPNYFNCDPNFNGLSWPTEYLWLDNTLIGIVKDGNLYYVETDQLGSPRAVIQPGYPSNDPSYGDKVVWKWDYAASAFGENVPNQDPTNSGTAFTLNLRYAGQYFDAETNNHYNYFRDYDPGTGRYVESDPVGIVGGLATYAYALSSPLMYRDIQGLDPCGGDCCKGETYSGEEAVTKCCNGSVVTCTNSKICDKWGGDGSEFCQILKKCIEKHEKLHREEHFDCSKNPPFDPNKKNGFECQAWQGTVKCMNAPCGSEECKGQKKLYLNGDSKNPGAITTMKQFCNAAKGPF